ncbi:MAG: Fic family protein [Deferribacteraceae bacterium]|jgi:Fic family protein|nr:Fic family protein [Deferribacteraceae bacterium]
MSYEKQCPPFTVTRKISRLTDEIVALTTRIDPDSIDERKSFIESIRGTLAIEGNPLDETQIAAVLDGSDVEATPTDLLEVKGAIAAYKMIRKWQPHKEKDIMKAHELLTEGLLDNSGTYRERGTGVRTGKKYVHVAPQAPKVPGLMKDLMSWLKLEEEHPLITSAIFHYEFEFIHPFTDGNGRMGRLWHTVILSHWNPIFAKIPIEKFIFARRSDYYEALRESSMEVDSYPLIEFLLEVTLEAVSSFVSKPQIQLPAEVERLLSVLQTELSIGELQDKLGVADRRTFKKRYLAPALELKVVELTLPDKPKSRLQKYRKVL